MGDARAVVATAVGAATATEAVATAGAAMVVAVGGGEGDTGGGVGGGGNGGRRWATRGRRRCAQWQSYRNQMHSEAIKRPISA